MTPALTPSITNVFHIIEAAETVTKQSGSKRLNSRNLGSNFDRNLGNNSCRFSETPEGIWNKILREIVGEIFVGIRKGFLEEFQNELLETS